MNDYIMLCYEYCYEGYISYLKYLMTLEHSKKPVKSAAPVKFHESHRRVMRSVNRNR